MTTQEKDAWCIRRPDGEIQRGTLDQLQEAFDMGAVDASTLVLAPGTTQWRTLGDLAGLDELTQPAPVPRKPRAFALWVATGVVVMLAIGGAGALMAYRRAPRVPLAPVVAMPPAPPPAPAPTPTGGATSEAQPTPAAVSDRIAPEPEPTMVAKHIDQKKPDARPQRQRPAGRRGQRELPHESKPCTCAHLDPMCSCL
jgi:hypothetical protein